MMAEQEIDLLDPEIQTCRYPEDQAMRDQAHHPIAERRILYAWL